MKTTTNLNESEIIKIMIAEDHVMMRHALMDNIHDHSDRLKVIGSAENGVALLELVKKNVPDIVILDMGMPVMNGNEVLAVFKKEYPGIKSIVYSNDYSDYHVAKAVLNGAAAYINKLSGNINELTTAIEKVCEFGYHFNEDAAKEIILSLHHQKKIYFLIENKKFSEREIEILRQICLNKQTKQIAGDLNIARGTVKYHKGKLLEKTESESTIDLVTYAIRQGIFNLSEIKSPNKYSKKY